MAAVSFKKHLTPLNMAHVGLTVASLVAIVFFRENRIFSSPINRGMFFLGNTTLVASLLILFIRCKKDKVKLKEISLPHPMKIPNHLPIPVPEVQLVQIIHFLGLNEVASLLGTSKKCFYIVIKESQHLRWKSLMTQFPFNGATNIPRNWFFTYLVMYGNKVPYSQHVQCLNLRYPLTCPQEQLGVRNFKYLTTNIGTLGGRDIIGIDIIDGKEGSFTANGLTFSFRFERHDKFFRGAFKIGEVDAHFQTELPRYANYLLNRPFKVFTFDVANITLDGKSYIFGRFGMQEEYRQGVFVSFYIEIESIDKFSFVFFPREVQELPHKIDLKRKLCYLSNSQKFFGLWDLQNRRFIIRPKELRGDLGSSEDDYFLWGNKLLRINNNDVINCWELIIPPSAIPHVHDASN